jgi:hypothetical protein
MIATAYFLDWRGRMDLAMKYSSNLSILCKGARTYS